MVTLTTDTHPSFRTLDTTADNNSFRLPDGTFDQLATTPGQIDPFVTDPTMSGQLRTGAMTSPPNMANEDAQRTDAAITRLDELHQNVFDAEQAVANAPSLSAAIGESSRVAHANRELDEYLASAE